MVSWLHPDKTFKMEDCGESAQFHGAGERGEADQDPDGPKTTQRLSERAMLE